MKKIVLIVMLFGLVFLTSQEVFVKSHTAYQEFDLTSGKQLKDYQSSDLKGSYKKVDVRKFWGWRTEKILSSEKVYFTYETLFTYYNDGYTTIDYTYKKEDVETSKFSIAATGSIGASLGKSGTGFKNGLDGSLKIEGKYEQSQNSKETFELKLKVDPGTQVNIVIKGEGYLTNGVAAHYRFWVRSNRGGFEYFEVSTQYQDLEKIRI